MLGIFAGAYWLPGVGFEPGGHGKVSDMVRQGNDLT